MEVSLAELLAIAVLGIFAGALGAVTGLGGGVVIVPALVLVFGFDFPSAVGASLAAVIATSTTTGSAYVGGGLTNMRLAMTLEVATTLGGISGGLLGVALSERVLAAVFAATMAVTAYFMTQGRQSKVVGRRATDLSTDEIPTDSGPLDARYFEPETGRRVVYQVDRVPMGMGISYGAGVASGLLGVGGGFIKVPAMTLAMKVPLKVAVATSNFMIGITAVSGFLVYLGRGEVHPAASVPLILGTIGGGLIGTRARIGDRTVRIALGAILLIASVQMSLRAFGVGDG